MPVFSRIVPNTYRDSVSLMQLSASLKGIAGVEEASAIMATAGNLALLAEVGLAEAGVAPRPSDLLVVVRARTESAANTAIARVEASLRRAAPASAADGASPAMPPRSIAMAVGEAALANLALDLGPRRVRCRGSGKGTRPRAQRHALQRQRARSPTRSR